MSEQLFQLLTRLDRVGATELVIASGRPVTLRINGTYQTLTAGPVSTAQLMQLIAETPLATMLPEVSGLSEPEDVVLGTRTLRTQVIRNGDELILRFENLKPVAAAEPMPAPMPRAHAPGVARIATPAPGVPVVIRPGTPPAAAPTPIAAPVAQPPVAFRPPEPTPVAFRAVEPPAATFRTPEPAPAPAPSATFRAPEPASSPSATFRTPEPAPVQPRTPTPQRVTPPAPQPTPVVVQPPHVPAPATEAIAQLVDEPCEITPGLAAIVREARQRAATDLHLAANRPVMIRAVGELVPLDPKPRTASEIAQLLVPLLGPVRRQQLQDRGYVDLAVEIPGAGRLRGNVSRQQGGLKGTFRLAVSKPPTLDELGLPEALARITTYHQGLVVIAGPSGHGKTTTLAALVDLLNSTEPIHILSIEDPVEIEHPRKAAVVSQREVGRHTTSFAAALKASLREDPDVIVIGELRDRETVEIALTAAETGHLVIATMSTPSAAKTIDRLIDMFPPDDQSQVRASLAGALRAIVAQRLLPSASGDAMVAAVELVVGVLPLATLIRDNKLYQLPNLMQRGRAYGMIRLDESLYGLVRSGRITEDVAMRAADSKKELAVALHPETSPAALAAAAKARGGLFGKKGPD